MKNKLYIWHGVLTDYSDGMITISAPSLSAARKYARKNFPDYVSRDTNYKPSKVIRATGGSWVHGGS